MSPRSRRPAQKPPPPKATRAEQKLETRDRLRQAAWELFTTRGFEATTTKQIAERAGVAAGTVFVHASDKGDLLFLVMHDRLATTVDAAMASMRPATLVQELLHLFGALFRMYGEEPAVAAAFVRHFPGAKGPNAARVDALTVDFLHRVGELVNRAKERGEVADDVDVGLAAHTLFALYFSALLGWIAGYATLAAALRPGLSSALQLLLRGLSPRTTGAPRVKASRAPPTSRTRRNRPSR